MKHEQSLQKAYQLLRNKFQLNIVRTFILGEITWKQGKKLSRNTGQNPILWETHPEFPPKKLTLS